MSIKYNLNIKNYTSWTRFHIKTLISVLSQKLYEPRMNWINSLSEVMSSSHYFSSWWFIIPHHATTICTHVFTSIAILLLQFKCYIYYYLIYTQKVFFLSIKSLYAILIELKKIYIVVFEVWNMSWPKLSLLCLLSHVS